MTTVDAELCHAVQNRFYTWCVRQCTLEIDASFAHVKTIRAGKLQGILECIEAWPVADQRSFMLGNMTDNVGTPEQIEEVSLAQRNLMKDVALAAGRGYGPRAAAATAEWFQGAFRPRASEVRKGLKRDFTNVLGPAEKLDDVSHWLHRTSVGPWTVETYARSGGDTRGQFEYSHTLSRGGVSITGPVFPAGWWGISRNASWDRVRTDDIDGATRAAADLCKWFIEQVPEIVKGL